VIPNFLKKEKLKFILFFFFFLPGHVLLGSGESVESCLTCTLGSGAQT
jgi:hypothetical protein